MTSDESAAGKTLPARPMADIPGDMWQLPAILFANWWNMMVFAWFPGPFGHGHWHAPDEQLVVPEPLEESGERALFA